MTENKELATFVVFGISIYLFIEAFTNFALYVNAVLFLRWKNLSVVLGWIILYLSVLFGLIILFSLKKPHNSKKIYILLFMIVGFRILTLFYLIGEIYLLFLTILFASLLLFLVEFFIMSKKSKMDVRTLIAGMIFGTGIHFFLLTLNMTSNLSVELLKFPIIFTFAAIVLWFNVKFFKPIPENIKEREVQQDKDSDLIELNPIHFLLFGITLFFGLSWILNPMGLAAYDIYILDWVDYSFIYYTVIILGALIISYFIIDNLLKKTDMGQFKKLLISFNGIFCGINCLALIIIESDTTYISTIYITALTFLSILTIFFNIAFILQFYTIQNRLKSLIGIIFFIIGFVLSYSVAIIFTWTLYITLLVSVLILSAVYFCLFMVNEIRNISKHEIIRSDFINRNKLYAVIFSILFLLNIGAIALITLERSYEEPSSGDPTVMIWNIHNGIGSDGEFDLDRIVSEIKKYDPDVLGLNEVDMGVMKTSFVDIASYFAQELDMYFFYGPTFFNHYGNAIFSKYPFEEVETIDLPVAEGIRSEPRGVIKAKVEIDDDVWTFYVNHLATNEEHRKEQVPFVVELMEEEDFENVVWLGDFNMEPDSDPYDLVNNTDDDIQLIDTHLFLEDHPDDTGGFDPNRGYKATHRIDYIFCSPDLEPKKAKVHWSLASDHCAVITEF